MESHTQMPHTMPMPMPMMMMPMYFDFTVENTFLFEKFTSDSQLTFWLWAAGIALSCILL